MWNEWKEILAWFKGTEEASTPDQSAMDGLMRLVAATTMASLNEARQMRENPPHLSDSTPPPVDQDEQPQIAPVPEDKENKTSSGASRQTDEQPPPAPK